MIARLAILIYKFNHIGRTIVAPLPAVDLQLRPFSPSPEHL